MRVDRGKRVCDSAMLADSMRYPFDERQPRRVPLLGSSHVHYTSRRARGSGGQRHIGCCAPLVPLRLPMLPARFEVRLGSLALFDPGNATRALPAAEFFWLA